mgnify:CR=1 FL=1
MYRNFHVRYNAAYKTGSCGAVTFLITIELKVHKIIEKAPRDGFLKVWQRYQKSTFRYYYTIFNNMFIKRYLTSSWPISPVLLGKAALEILTNRNPAAFSVHP